MMWDTIGPAGIKIAGCPVRWGEMKVRPRDQIFNMVVFQDGSYVLFVSKDIESVMQVNRGTMYTLSGLTDGIAGETLGASIGALVERLNTPRRC